MDSAAMIKMRCVVDTLRRSNRGENKNPMNRFATVFPRLMLPKAVLVSVILNVELQSSQKPLVMSMTMTSDET